ncbi:MAG: polysaccharide biosynthesis protein [Candidatus Kerfeldbacteria bacterium]|nr:polysaccharide biosynthesis protein [Candidatus Kerfeldbacteria bacterium]
MNIAHNTITNSIASFLGFLSLAISAFIVTPYTINQLHDTRYGVYAILFAVTGLLNFLDFGLAYSSIRFITEARETGDLSKLNRIINMNVIIFIGVGVGLVMLTIVVMQPVIQIMNIPSELYAETRLALLLAVMSLPAFLIMSVYNAVLQAYQKFTTINIVLIINTILFTSVTFLVLYYQPSVVNLMAVNLGSAATLMLTYLVITKITLPTYRISIVFDYAIFKQLFSFSASTFFIIIANRLLFQVDRLFVSWLYGPSYVAYYSIPSAVGTKIHGTIANINQILFPLSAAFDTQKRTAELISLYIKATKVNLVGLVAMGVPLVVYSDKLIELWLGQAYVGPCGFLLKLSVIGYSLFSLTSIQTSFLAGFNKQKQSMYFMVGIALSNITLLLLFTPTWGLPGAALAFIGAHWVLLLMQRYTERQLKIGWLFQATVWLRTLPVIVLSASVLYLTLPAIQHVSALLLSLVMAGCGIIALSSIVMLNQEDRTIFLSYIKKLIPSKA